MSPWQAAKLQRIAKGDFSVQFALSLALKDVRLALEGWPPSVSGRLPAWRTNGKKSSILDSATGPHGRCTAEQRGEAQPRLVACLVGHWRFSQ